MRTPAVLGRNPREHGQQVLQSRGGRLYSCSRGSTLWNFTVKISGTRRRKMIFRIKLTEKGRFIQYLAYFSISSRPTSRPLAPPTSALVYILSPGRGYYLSLPTRIVCLARAGHLFYPVERLARVVRSVL